MAGRRRRQLLPIPQVLPSHAAAFGRVIGAKLRDRSSCFARSYLLAVVDRVVVTGDMAEISGSNAGMMAMIAGQKLGTDQVPSFMEDWRARRDSNSRPPGS